MKYQLFFCVESKGRTCFRIIFQDHNQIHVNKSFYPENVSNQTLQALGRFTQTQAEESRIKWERYEI